MAAQTKGLLESSATVIKIKLGSNNEANGNIECLKKITQIIADFKSRHSSAMTPEIQLSIDFNEGCVRTDEQGTKVPDIAHCNEVLAFAAEHHIDFVEQPFPAGYDTKDVFAGLNKHGVPILADESCHTADNLSAVLGDYGYDGVVMKLGKTGGLRNAIKMVDKMHAEYPDALLCVGSMASSSLASAADYALAAYAQKTGANLCRVDVDSPTLMGHQNDRAHCMEMKGGVLYAPPARLWGAGASAGDTLTLPASHTDRITARQTAFPEEVGR
jgi:L-alanine-DL-glutamate epimerase-like enolase superfamily enzyme